MATTDVAEQFADLTVLFHQQVYDIGIAHGYLS